jgi:hypothetical protein
MWDNPGTEQLRVASKTLKTSLVGGAVFVNVIVIHSPVRILKLSGCGVNAS